jgi:hypothetical protein
MFLLLADQPAHPHRWTAAQAATNLSQSEDPTVVGVAKELRVAYGEDRVLDRLDELIDSGVALRFDTAALLRGFRGGLPDSAAERGKPAALRNSRSEPAEMVARLALREIAGVQFPVGGQLTKGNPNQPVLGFDAWGVAKEGAGATLVLVQVKATDDPARPPGPSAELAVECQRAGGQRDRILRALGALAAAGALEQDLLLAILALLEAIGNGQPPSIRIAPVFVRGRVAAHIDDLAEIRAAPPAEPVHGLSVGVGAPLSDFGEAVLRYARGS